MSDQESTPDAGKQPDSETPKTEEKVDAPVAQSFDAEYVKTLRNEAAQRRKENQELKTRLDELEERDKSELEKALSKVTKAEQAKAEAEAKLTRYEVATEKQIPSDYLDLLVGSTRDELEARAEKIAQLAKDRNTIDKPDFDGGAREPAPEPKSAEEEHNDFFLQLLGRQPNT